MTIIVASPVVVKKLMQRLRQPAEWEPQDAIWLARPHSREEWGHYFDEATAAIERLIGELIVDEQVELLVSRHSENLGHQNLREHLVPYGDIWLRDTGPVFVHKSDTLVARTFQFNGWGGKFLFTHDKKVSNTIAGLASTQCTYHPLVLEGGAIDSNGCGTVLTTRQCLLNKNRNPQANESDIEKTLRSALGTRKVIWLDSGLAGDHTDGHVDNLARFVAPTHVVCMAPGQSDDPNKAILREIRNKLSAARTADGDALEITEIPSPGFIEGPMGIMAASYCNFLITNHSVFVPTFDVESDQDAVSILSALFPKRRVVGMPSYALLTGGGTLHCISLQQPSKTSCSGPLHCDQ